MILFSKSIYLKKIDRLFLTILFFNFTQQNFAQQNHAISIDAKVWSKNAEKKIQYSDWKSFPSIIVDSIQDYSKIKSLTADQFGGDNSIVFNATGFFRTQKINDRWWVIDPLGHPFVVTAVNGIRLGKSPNNEKAFNEKFIKNDKWIQSTSSLLHESGFNVAGSWSDVETIINYNKTSKQPLVYTTQLSLVPAFKKYITKKDPSRKSESDLTLMLDSEFSSFCEEETKKISNTINDPNLLGHFSDNELPFTNSELNNVLKSENNETPGLKSIKQWMMEKGIDEKNITTQQKDELLGWIAGQYYSTVYKAVKKNDPNHLYIGSRLHAAAKNNPYIIKAATPFIDIFSINYYGFWEPKLSHITDWANWSNKPFFITEFYTKAEETGMPNMSGAGWLVKTQKDRGIHYQNFCLQLLKAKNCVGWHWFRYQDNDPSDLSADPSNNDSNKGIVNTYYDAYQELIKWMKQLNDNKYALIKYFDCHK